MRYRARASASSIGASVATRQLREVVLPRIVLLDGLVESTHQLHRSIDQLDEVREGVAEEAADAQRDVDPGPPEPLERDDGEILNAPRLRVPHGFDAEQGEHLCHVVALGAHLRGAPGARPIISG